MKTLKKIDALIRKLLIAINQLTLINIYLKLVRSGVNISLNNDVYVASDNNNKIYFHHIDRVFLFVKGMQRRKDQLIHAYFIDKVEFSPGDVVIDCGANIGEIGSIVNNFTYKCEYIAFEPSDNERECILKNNTNATIYKYALWFENTTLDFYICSELADSSAIEPYKFSNVIKVKAKRLDFLFPNTIIKFLKVEAEGGELEVLKGCEKIFQNIEYISADLGFERGVSKESTLIPVVNYLLHNGFIVINVDYQRLNVLFYNNKYNPITD